MKIREGISTIRKNFDHKAIFVAIFSLIVNVAFIVYNMYLGISFRDGFAIGISIYYFLLLWIISVTLILEKYISKSDEKVRNNIRIRNYKISSIFVFIIDFCLIAPIILRVTNPKDVNFGLIPAIAMATYCVYKITIAIINYVRSKKSQNPTTILLKEINIIGAIVSILTLQHTLIMVNGGMDNSMRILSLVTSIIFLILIILFTIISYIQNKKVFKKL